MDRFSPTIREKSRATDTETMRPSSGPTACWPCAKAKSKCLYLSERTLPGGKCTRCNRLNKECTKQIATPRRNRFSTFGLPRLVPNDTAVPVGVSEPNVCPSLGCSTGSRPTLNAPGYSKQSKAPSAFTSPSAFLGPTSFSAVFSDNRNNFGSASSNSVTATETPTSVAPRNQATGEADIDTDLIKMGIKVLTQIPNEVACDVLFSRHTNPNDGSIRLAWKRLSSSLHLEHGAILERRQPEVMESWAQQISINTNSELFEEEDPVKWFKAFSGFNLRWEALGILFTYWSFGALASAEDDSIFTFACTRQKNRIQMMIEMKQCAASCIALSSHVDHGNSLLVYLLYKHSLLETMVSGDASLIYWRQHGELCSMTTALGLHRDDNQTSKNVNVCSELRRITYAAVYNIDKVASTFTGRPPMLSDRYSSTPLPLDLSDEQLLSDRVSLAESLRRLDANGWNTDGHLYSTTILRARTSLSVIRGEILDIALCSAWDGLGGRVLELRQRSKVIYAQLPAVIVYKASDLSDPNIRGTELYSRLLTRLDHLQNLFLLERIMIKHEDSNTQDLVDISREMLILTSGFWKERDRLLGLKGDFEWLVMYHAVPASGILCLELLKQQRDLSYTLTLPRSDSIQDLIMFVSFLHWVKPGAPNYGLCQRIGEIVGRVLDQVLETPEVSNNGSTTTAMTPPPLDFSFDTDLRDFDEYAMFDLLDTYDWCNMSWET